MGIGRVSHDIPISAVIPETPEAQALLGRKRLNKLREEAYRITAESEA